MLRTSVCEDEAFLLGEAWVGEEYGNDSSSHPDKRLLPQGSLIAKDEVLYTTLETPQEQSGQSRPVITVTLLPDVQDH